MLLRQSKENHEGHKKMSNLLGLKDTCLQQIILQNSLYKLEMQNLPIELLENIMIQMHDQKKLNDSNIQHFAKTHWIDLSNNFITDIGLQRFSSAANGSLRWANLSGLMISDESVCLLARNSPALERIDLVSCFDLTNICLKELAANCPKLTHINISSTSITDDGLAHLSKLTQLKSLNLSGCVSVVGTFVENLVQSPVANSLEFINLSGCVGISTAAVRKLVRKCQQIRTVFLNEMKQLQNEDVQTILKYSKQLVTLGISNLPALTNEIIKFFMTWINVNARLGRASHLRRVELIGNKQLDVRQISLLAQMALNLGSDLEIIGGQVQLSFLRNNSALDPIVLNVDRFTSIAIIIKRLVPLVNAEEESKNSKTRWSYDELSIQAVSYRNNGTKRPARMRYGIKRDTIVMEVVGQRKNHLYLQQAKREINYDEHFVVLTLKRWDQSIQKIVDIGDYSFASSTTLRQLKQHLTTSNEFGVRNVPLARLLIVEEETSFKLNTLLNDNMTISEYHLVTGDIIHIEETSEPIMENFNEEKTTAINSKIGQYLLAKKSVVLVEETSDSFKSRVTNWMYMPKLKPMSFEVEVSGTDSMEDLQKQIEKLSGIEISKQKIATRVDPDVVIATNAMEDESPRRKKLSEVLRGNQWLMLSVQCN